MSVKLLTDMDRFLFNSYACRTLQNTKTASGTCVISNTFPPLLSNPRVMHINSILQMVARYRTELCCESLVRWTFHVACQSSKKVFFIIDVVGMICFKKKLTKAMPWWIKRGHWKVSFMLFLCLVCFPW